VSGVKNFDLLLDDKTDNLLLAHLSCEVFELVDPFAKVSQFFFGYFIIRVVASIDVGTFEQIKQAVLFFGGSWENLKKTRIQRSDFFPKQVNVVQSRTATCEDF